MVGNWRLSARRTEASNGTCLRMWFSVTGLPVSRPWKIGLLRWVIAVMRATGATAYNILQNNGSEAHQVVMHVHFHIIPKFGQEGLGIGWPARKLSESTARELSERMRKALES